MKSQLLSFVLKFRSETLIFGSWVLMERHLNKRRFNYFIACFIYKCLPTDRE